MANNVSAGLIGRLTCGVVIVFLTISSTAPVYSQQALSKITAPPAGEIARLGLDKDFYKKYINTSLPVISSEKVSDAALREASYLVGKILGGRTEMLKALNKAGTRIVVMAYNEFTTDIPVSRRMDPDFWNMRARGICGGSMVSCAEENLLSFKGDPYYTESIFIHEFAHKIHGGAGMVDKTFEKRLREVHAAGKSKGLWKGTYASNNHGELWAEAVQTWFNTNRENDSLHNHVNLRKELKEYDPALAKLVEEVLGDTPWRYTKVTDRKDKELDHLKGYDPSKAPTFAWPKRVRDGYKRWQAAEKAKKEQTKKTLNIHLIGGAREYRAVESLTAWQERMEKKYLVRCTRSFGVDKAKKLGNLQRLKDADLLVVYARRLQISGDQLKMVKDYIASGRPIIGLRTASHAFQKYLEFDREVLGGSYSGHLGDEKGIKVIVNTRTARHPVLAGVYEWTRSGKLYRNKELGKGVTLLLTGKAAKESHPVAWVRTIGKQRVFYTSLGVPADFANDTFNTLLDNAVEWTAKRTLSPRAASKKQ
ncbi:MAG: ThuA domain-containing protein [Phycisphaerae bacterium]|jgi:type 1 glutamine amidotransferase|nr:ThuA domain-containing protein [Phycisphaerae bacterium]